MSAPSPAHLTMIVGSGRDLVRAAPLYRELRRRDTMRVALVLTGQERDADLMSGYFRGLALPQPDGLLEPGGGTRTEQTGRTFAACEMFLRHSPTQLVVLQGSTDAMIACAVVCKHHGLPLVRLEAGLRGQDRQLPEDVVCEVVDHLCDHWFAPWRQAAEALEAESLPADRIAQPGNLMVDTLQAYRADAAATPFWDDLALGREEFGLVALTTPRILTNPTNLRKVVDAVAALARDIALVLPITPEARRRLTNWNLDDHLNALPDLRMPDARGFLDTFGLIGRALLLVTDSGDLQDQASFLGVPCLCVAETSDRPVTLAQGTNTLVGPDTAAIVGYCQAILEGRRKRPALPDDWDGQAAGRIAQALEEVVGSAARPQRGNG